MTGRIAVCLWLVCTFAVSGCVATSEHPHIAKASSTDDPRLQGVWVMPADKDTIWLHVGKRESAGLSLLLVTHPSKPGRSLDTMGGQLLTAPVGTDHVASLAFEWETDEDGGVKPTEKQAWFLLRYRLDGDALTFERLDNDATTAAIRKGEVAGDAPSAEPDAQGDRKAGPPVLRAPPEALSAWLAGKRAVWVEFAVFKRVPFPAPPPASSPVKPPKSK